jgi:CHAT domain-containing protein/tetratricopeptide (TPR) repeat protein
MFFLKQLVIIFLTPLLCLAGLLSISTSYWTDTPSKPTITSNYILFDSTQVTSPSQSCLEIEYQISNSQIDYKHIKKEINNLNSSFEKDYLTALIYKRAGNYEAAYNSLLKHIDINTSHFEFYDELITVARITGNLEKIKEQLADKSEASHYTLYLSGLIKFESGKYQKSIAEFEKIIAGGFVSESVYYRLAYANRLIGDYEKSLEWLTEAESLLDSTDRFLAKVINAKGSIYFLSDEYELAEKLYIDANSKAIATGDVVEEIKSMGNLAMIKDLYGDVYTAREDLSKAIQKASKTENIDLLAFLYSELGVSFTFTSENIDAREKYESSYEYYTILKNHERLSYLASNIGSIYLQQANYKSALKYYKEGLKHSGENKLGLILNLTGIADVYANSSNYSIAIEYYNKAKQLADSINAISSVVRIEQGIGALFYNINRPYRALNFLLEAEKRLEVNELPFEATELYYKIGTVLASIDSIYQAENYLSKGLEIAKRTGDLYYEVILNTELAYIFYLQEEYAKALVHLNDAMRISEEYELLQLISLQKLYLGKILWAQNLESRAIEHLAKSFELAGQASDYNTQVEAGYHLAKYNITINKTNEAENWFKQSIDIIERVSLSLVQSQEIQIAHFSAFDEIYNSLIEFYLNEERTVKAFEILERSRSRNTMQNLVNLKLISSIADEEMLNRYLDLNWMITSGLFLDEEKNSFIKEAEELQKKFVQKNPELEQYILNSPWKNLEEIQYSLNEDDNLISVYVNENKIYLFHLTKDDFQTKNISLGREALRTLLDNIAPIYRSDLVRDEIYINQDLFSFDAEASWELYRLVFKDLIEQIPTEEVLIFSFSNELLVLPAELLVVEWDAGDSPYYYEDKKFLIQKHPIMYSPSASIYAVQQEKTLSGNEYNLLVGNPEISNDDFEISYRSGLLSEDEYSLRNIELFPLKYSAEEIENVDDIIENNIVLLSENATEENFKSNASSSKLIHLSTHSFLYKNQPLIIFSTQENDPDDGFLEISEIVQMDLNCDLVVLSSCRSGLGKIDEAEGILGMQKAFFEAGANSIVVSLWDVNDEYTSYFMKDFYNYLSEGYDKPEALRKTKLDFAKKYSANPYYWSAFVLSGNSSSINLSTASSFNLFFTLILILILLVVSAVTYQFSRMRKTW